MGSHHGGHHHDHGHRHGHAPRALGLALGITVVFMLVEAVGGWLSHSLALLADAAHMATDAAALGLALFAAWIARRPPSTARTYGWLRAEVLAALVNAALLLAVTVGIIWEAIQRLLAPRDVDALTMFWVALAGFVANLASALVLHRSRNHSLNLRGAYLHVLSDLAGSAAAMVAAIWIRLTDQVQADPLLSLAMAVLLLVSSVRLLWQAVDVLLEAAPRNVDVTALQAAMAAVPGVQRVHDVHVWTVASGLVAMSGHAVVGDQGRMPAALHEMTERVRAFGIAHTTIQLEAEGDCVGCETPTTLPLAQVDQ